MSISLSDLVKMCDDLLHPWAFDDYCPNGLQVEGKPEVAKLVTGVTASQALIERAISAHADLLLVHHGYFWKGDDNRVVGLLKRRLSLLLEKDISLLAYHLPLDAHPELGNNASLARVLGLNVTAGLEPGNERSIGLVGELSTPQQPDRFARHLENNLQRKPLHVPGNAKRIRSIAWCTGAAQGYIERAIVAGVDAYLTGEVSEQTVHIAREAGIHFYAAGHHATERYGVQSVGELIAQRTGIDYEFIDIDNPA